MNQENKSPITKSAGFDIASIACSLISYGLFYIYGYVHWDILFRKYSILSQIERDKWLSILGGLEIYRVFGLAAFILGIIACIKKSRISFLIFLPMAIFALLLSIVFM